MKHQLLKEFIKRDYNKIIEGVSVYYNNNWRCIDLAQEVCLKIYIAKEDIKDETYLVFLYDNVYLSVYSDIAIRASSYQWLYHADEMKKYIICSLPFELVLENNTKARFCYSQVKPETIYGLYKAIKELGA